MDPAVPLLPSMSILDERRARARRGTPTPRRLRGALAGALLGLLAAGAAFHHAQGALDQAAQLGPRAREDARRGALQGLDAYAAARAAIQQRQLQGDDAGAAAAEHEAESLLHVQVLPALGDDAVLRAARALEPPHRQALASSRGVLAGAGLLLLLTLLGAQIELARRTRRIFNPPLLMATALAGGALLEQLRRATGALAALSPENALASTAHHTAGVGAPGLAALVAAAALATLGFWRGWRSFE